jgi:glycerophosphoryl diester phosphodiesterase
MNRRKLQAFCCFFTLVGLGIVARAQPRTPLVIAHRGGAQESTENTIAAFETDLRLTRDGVVVVYHDEKVGRVEGLPLKEQTRPVSDVTYAELAARTLKPVGDDAGGRRVPTLDELLGGVKAGLLNIELKRGARFDELVDKVIAALKNSPALDRVVLEPPDLQTAQKLRAALGARLKLHVNPGYDTSADFVTALKRVLAFKPHSISVSYKKLSWEIVDLAHRAGVEVWVWTVDTPEIAEAARLLGADAIKTDKPTLLLNLFNRRAER